MGGEKWSCPKCGCDMTWLRLHGCERSGTSVTQYVLRKCFPQLQLTTVDKHREMPPGGKTPVIFITKGPLSWAVSVFRHPGKGNWTWLKEPDGSLDFGRWFKVNRPLQRWSHIHRSWMENVEKNGISSFVWRYQEFLSDNAAQINKLSLFIHQTPETLEKLQPSHRVGFPAQDFDHQWYPQSKWVEFYTPELVALALEDIDPEVVEWFGHKDPRELHNGDDILDVLKELAAKDERDPVEDLSEALGLDKERIVEAIKAPDAAVEDLKRLEEQMATVAHEALGEKGTETATEAVLKMGYPVSAAAAPPAKKKKPAKKSPKKQTAEKATEEKE